MTRCPLFRLPNALIYLTSLIRPNLLRPDLRVPTIAHIDFLALRAKGLNAVVVDKDNCLTVPNEDELYPTLKTAWTDLLSAFEPGRVLVVSNSAGTKKDPGGIAAESLSLTLHTPVLLHPTPKPGCAPQILSYFRGHLAPPHTLRREIVDRGKKLAEIEKGDEDEVLERWMGEVEHGLLLGPPHGREGRKRLESRMVDRNADPTSKSDSEKPDGDVKKASGGVKEEPRIVVVGDRLFTDTVLAHRLSVHLGGAEDDDPKVISIHTTQLPEPRDVRLIRWVEERLSGGKVKGGKVDWGRYTREAELGEKLETSVERGQRSLGLDPRTWRVIPLLKGLGRGVGATARFLGRGVRWVWARARRRAAKLEMEVEGVKGSNVA